MASNDASDQDSALHIMYSMIEPLTAANVRGVRLPWLSRFNYANLSAHLEENPGKSLRAVGTNEYIVGERWRRRDDIANIREVGARKHKRLLVEGLARELEADGSKLVLVNEDVWRDEAGLFSELGFGLIERIVFFDRNIPVKGSRDDKGWDVEVPALEYSVATMADLDALLEVDHTSFPWLWWNSRDEMGTYLLTKDVVVFLARWNSEPVGYASFTMYNGWSHLDRLAVIEGQQGHGYGAAQLVNVMREMQSRGARNVGLSTQEQNVQSHRLYKRFDFRLGRESMALYGRWAKER
jgi:ribosomal protein S18 acetylase RimI-like enzyme